MSGKLIECEEECLDRIVPLGEGHLHRTLQEFPVHYHRERNHQGFEERADRPSDDATTEWPGSPLAVSRRDPELLLSVGCIAVLGAAV